MCPTAARGVDTRVPSRDHGCVSATLPTGVVTLLFTDVEGSTKLLHELGDAYADALHVSVRLGGHERMFPQLLTCAIWCEKVAFTDLPGEWVCGGHGSF